MRKTKSLSFKKEISGALAEGEINKTSFGTVTSFATLSAVTEQVGPMTASGENFFMRSVATASDRSG